MPTSRGSCSDRTGDLVAARRWSTARALVGVAIAVVVAVLLPPGAAQAQAAPFERGIEAACDAEARGFDPFPDSGPGAHHEAINCIAYLGVTRGQTVDGVPAYVPGGTVTRAQMASFIARTLDAVEGYELPADPEDATFPDVAGEHERSINRLAAVGIVEGRADGTYDPAGDVRRDQMASYVARSLEEVAGTTLPTAAIFVDDIPEAHAPNVHKLAAIGVVAGIDGELYGAEQPVTRQQMASFLARALDYLAAEEGATIVAETPIFPQQLGSFSTPLQPGQARNHNIHLAADYIDGDTIAPGETYSLNHGIGERTRARGFQDNGFIDEDGNIISVLGGGISQLGTTFFNAAWFAGIELLEHRPHSQYLERYPPGREATLTWDQLDVVVRNDTPFPIEIATTYTDSQVTVIIIGTPWGEVTDTWDDAPADVSSGQAFSVNYGRTVTYPDGSTAQDRFSWTYEPAP